MAETGLTKQRVIADLTRSPHGKLEDYLPVGMQVVKEDPEFFARLTAWAALKSEVRDVKVALPVIGLGSKDEVSAENAAAHMADLDPRLFLKAVEFARNMPTTQAPRRVVARLVERYLRNLEADTRKWEPVVLQHRHVLRRLYTWFHVKPSDMANRVVVHGEAPAGTVFATLRGLYDMSPTEAAGAIITKRIPFLIAAGAMKEKLKSTDVLMALIGRMTPNELVTNAKRLEKLGIKNEPALRAAFEEALGKAATSKKGKASLKATRAAEHVGDKQMATKLKALQEKQLDRISIDGNWLVLGDKSSSMTASIEAAQQVAAVLARCVTGRVSLVFFDASPRAFDVTGKTYEEIKAIRVSASGMTSIGCGLAWALEQKLPFDGIAVVSDGGENTAPMFAQTYVKYCEKLDVAPPVYFYRLSGDSDRFTHNCASVGLDLQAFDLTGGVDYYSLPNVVTSMRASRYGLLDEIMATPLKTLDEVLALTKGTTVFARPVSARV